MTKLRHKIFDIFEKHKMLTNDWSVSDVLDDLVALFNLEGKLEPEKECGCNEELRTFCEEHYREYVTGQPEPEEPTSSNEFKDTKLSFADKDELIRKVQEKHESQNKDWEEEFDERFFGGDWDRFKRQDPNVIKQFISDLLTTERERLIEEVDRLFAFRGPEETDEDILSKLKKGIRNE